MSPSRITAALLLALAACGGEETPSTPLAPPEPGQGFQVSFTTEAAPGEEIWKCKIFELPTEQFEYVNRVESVQNAGLHHMDLIALAFTGLDLEPGEYECADLYEQHAELMDDGLVFYAAQAAEQVVQLPEGTVAALPPRLTTLYEIHYVNTSDQPVEVFSYVNTYTIDPRDVRNEIWGQVVRDLNLSIPPNSQHTEWTRCVMSHDIDLLFMTSHTHQLARRVVVRLFDGEQVGDEIYVNTEWDTPYLKAFTPDPLSIPAGTGFEFRCEFDNPRDETVEWGFTADDEMCQIGLVFTPGETRRKCEPVASSDGLL